MIPIQFIPNQKQSMLKADIKRWWNSSEQLYEFAGYAGTGKTTILMHTFEELKIPFHRIAPMAFIGQAAIVMRMRGLYNAKTIHSWMFEPVQQQLTDSDGKVIMNGYYNVPEMGIGFQSKPLEGIDIIVVDEAGSVPMYLREELMSRNIKIIATGDLGQLPPVGDEPAFLYGKDIIVLDELMRQSSHSMIPHLAFRARNNLPIHKGFYGDVYVIDESELTNEMIFHANVVLCGKNKTRDKINHMVRHELLGITSEIPVYNERLVCRKNNWNLSVNGINLANGLAGVVTNMPGVHAFKDGMFNINFRPNMLDESFIDVPVDYEYMIADHETRKKIKNNKYRKGEKFEFGYALTTHMAQGSEYPNGIFIEEYLNPQFHSNLLYTGITRFYNSLIFVKRSKKLY